MLIFSACQRKSLDEDYVWQAFFVLLKEFVKLAMRAWHNTESVRGDLTLLCNILFLVTAKLQTFGDCQCLYPFFVGN